MSKISPLLSLIAGSVFLASCGSNLPIAGEIELNEQFVADFDLVDMNGEAATDERFEGKPMLIYFGFTSCPDVCPAALGVMVAALDSMGSAADDIQPLYITVDPERDTPERLADYLSFDPRLLGLTGDEESAKDARDQMRVFAAKVPLENSAIGYTVDHQSMFFFVNSEGQPTHAFRDSIPPQELGQRLRKLVG